jgi:putative transposase
MINKKTQLSVREQCNLLNINRSLLYYERAVPDDTCIANAIADLYAQYPVYGYRRLTACLKRQGYAVNGKHILRVMRQMGLRAIYPCPRTTIVDKQHYKYPYALRGMVINKPHQVWQIDISYLRTDHGFMYMNALIDVQTRYVVSWSISNSLDTESCIRTLEKAIDSHGIPDIINSDQGCQFTSQAWCNALHSRSILISMSGRGRSNDNAHIERLWRTLKYEWTIINGARTVADYKKLLPEFIHWYNHLRPHQSLGYRTPGEVLDITPYGYVDKANALTHIPTRTTTTITDVKDSLIL